MKTNLHGTPAILALTLSCSSLAFAQAGAKHVLTIGDDAPQLQVSQWIKGQPIGSLDKNKKYVVEFWASWCVPCKESIPHLTELQKKFGDKVTCIGIDSFETDWSKSAPFVKDMGGKMEYAVATDKLDNPGDRSGFMAKNWMMASQQNGIPTAFVVDEGKIAWIGSPTDLDKPLEEMVAGTWNKAGFKVEYETHMKTEQIEDSVQKAVKAKDWAAAMGELNELEKLGPLQAKDAEALRMDVYVQSKDIANIHRHFGEISGNLDDLIDSYSTAVDAQNEDAAIKSLDEVQASLDKQSASAKLQKLRVYLAANDSAQFSAYARSLVEGPDKDNATVLDGVAWLIAGPDPETNDKISKLKFPMGYGNAPNISANFRREELLPLAKTAIQRAITLTKGKDAGYFDTLAWVEYQSGHNDEAIKAEKSAEAKAPENTMERANYQFIAGWFGDNIKKASS